MTELDMVTHWPRFRPVAWRMAFVVVVVGAAMAAFAMGVEASERPGIGAESLLTRLYYCLGLFVLGGLDIGVPLGGPPLGRALLWFAYFGSPAITGLAVMEGVIRAAAPDRFKLRRASDHYVIVGHGALPALFLTRLADFSVRNTIVLVLAESVPMPIVPNRLRVVVVRGEIRSAALRESLRLDRAKQVVLAKTDGFASLDAAAMILNETPELSEKDEKQCRIIIHLSDLSLLHSVAGTKVGRECIIFNSYHIAATHLVRSELLDWFEHTEEDDMVVLGGFGRFGQTVLRELQSLASGRFDTVIIIDPNVERMAQVFDREVGFVKDCYQHHLIADDLNSPGVWTELEEQFALSKRAPAFVMGSGVDATNIHTALLTASTYTKSRILARVSGKSAFADDLANDTDIHIVSVAELVKDSMPATWFGQRKPKSRAATGL